MLALVFGLSFLLAPGAVLPSYGIEPAPATVPMARFFGVALVNVGLAVHLLRNPRDAAVQRRLVLAGVGGTAAGVAVAIRGQLDGLVNAMGWSTAAIQRLPLLGYAVHLRPGPTSA